MCIYTYIYIKKNLTTFGGKQEEKDEDRKNIKKTERNEKTMSGIARVNGTYVAA